jgi:hypothetical protein
MSIYIQANNHHMQKLLLSLTTISALRQQTLHLTRMNITNTGRLTMSTTLRYLENEEAFSEQIDTGTLAKRREMLLIYPPQKAFTFID